ncbi:hypothetical protein WA026_019649 [Henosepilachna vigintioctopunctata]|uniref:Uncharacterized protein n=1 Tax=Henosepilachna vigintioctopunctata TaxID=420089 RepID=A0AAW1TMY5_9CUCU
MHYATKNKSSQSHHFVFSTAHLKQTPTSELQPLGCEWSPENILKQEINRSQKIAPGRIINRYHVAKLFGSAFLKSGTPNNAIKGFQSTGVIIKIYGEKEIMHHLLLQWQTVILPTNRRVL